MSDDTITVHVVDKNRSINKDFVCQRAHILKHMKYFRPHLTLSSEEGAVPEVDISVHCDARVFDWLVNYIRESEPRPRISGGSVISLLVSSEFLQMDMLMAECLVYFRDHFRQVVKVPLDINCLSDTVVTKLSNITPDATLAQFKDTKDKLLSRIYFLRLQQRLQSRSWAFSSCKRCQQIVCSPQSCSHVVCPASESGLHEADHRWTLTGCLVHLRRTACAWRSIYWWLWSCATAVQCTDCSSFNLVAQLSVRTGEVDVSATLACRSCKASPFRGHVASPDLSTDVASTSVSSNWICTEPDIIEELVLARVAADAIAAAGPDIHAGIMDVSDVITLSTVDALVQSTAHRVGHRGKPPRPAAASAQQSAAASASQPRSATGGAPTAQKPSAAAPSPVLAPAAAAMPQLAPSVLMKSMPITMLSLDDLMSNKATLTGGAVAAAAQLAHAAHSSSSISENRQREWRIDHLRHNDELRMERLKHILIGVRWQDKRSEKVAPATRVHNAPVTSFGR